MKSFKLDRWIKQISQTEAQEISCSDCLDLVDEYVEAELAGGCLNPEMERVKQHLDQCKVCREDYQMLHDLVLEENEGRAPSIDDLKKAF
jgi:hypothetical protein